MDALTLALRLPGGVDGWVGEVLGGRVAERGPARELLARGGALTRLMALQRSVAVLGDGVFERSAFR